MEMRDGLEIPTPENATESKTLDAGSECEKSRCF